ncbi:MAG: hypothetical protein QGG71_17340 [Pirellulaceae bacterium]|jgi:hypothetical protein|nr:hypothetical protein [Pirellulaceae bacterium]
MGELQVNQMDQAAEKVLTPPGSDGLDGGGQLEAGGREESILARQVAEFRQERERWELHRQQEVERLREEGDLLAEAWQRLEAEERCLLAERELLRRGAANRLPNSMPAVSQATGEKPQTGGHDQDHLDWQQFQRLRREFQRNNRPAT